MWGGIQLEQSSCVRREMDCGHGDTDGDGSNDFCTANEATCMHNVVARGAARAIEELLSGADPAGSCCTHFNACP